jgi:hypothetical protein
MVNEHLEHFSKIKHDTKKMAHGTRKETLGVTKMLFEEISVSHLLHIWYWDPHQSSRIRCTCWTLRQQALDKFNSRRDGQRVNDIN